MIQVLSWVFHAPLFVATILYSLALGTTVSMAMIATVWFRFKPLFGTTLYAAVAISFYLLLFVEWDEKIGAGYIASQAGKAYA